MNDENVRIIIKDKSEPFHYAQMGFFRNGRMLEGWNILLEFAENNGILINVDSAKQKRIERLNKALQEFFKTHENLIVNHRTVFNVCKKTVNSKKPIYIQEKVCPSCEDVHKHFCFICNDETEHCRECHDDLYTDAHKNLIR